MPIYVYSNPGISPTHVKDPINPRKTIIIYPEHTNPVPIGGLLEIRVDNPATFDGEVASGQLLLKAVNPPSVKVVEPLIPEIVPVVLAPVVASEKKPVIAKSVPPKLNKNTSISIRVTHSCRNRR